ncbi:NADP-dependent malic enzyme [Candidatus Nomurabacteria bacterium]|nr:NADP-dependent malic enzyme [Candidatus Nomurabacteria bacterium]
MSEIHEELYKKSLELHAKYHGKIETISKIKLDSLDVLSLAYSPGVAEVSREIARDPSLAREYTLKRNTVAIVSDGSAILGLGNLGALASIPVMEGKAAIFKEFADVDAFPICLDTQDTEEIIKAVKQIAPVFGGINLEDISAPRCFEIEERLRKELNIPVMHDDQWGAGTVTLVGLINSLKLSGIKKEDVKIVINGIGAAGVATARLLIMYGIKNIIYCDSHGIIHSERTDLTKEKKELLEMSNAHMEKGGLADAVKNANVFIGLSKPGLLTGEMVRSMAEKPIIFALANPTPEIMPDEAYEAGAFIVATGRSDFQNQLNNSLVFPGAFKGMLENNIPQFKTEMFLDIAEALADSVTDLSVNKILPSMLDKNVVKIVSEVIQKYK